MKFFGRKSKSGFTLIELLVVVAIIGILASVVLASLNTARAKGRDARRVSEIRSIRNALELYYSDYGVYPQYKTGSPTCSSGWAVNGGGYQACWADLQTKLSPYISKLPQDPLNAYPPTMSYEGYDYNAPSDGSKYCIMAQLEVMDPNKDEGCYGGPWYCLGAYTGACNI